MTIEKAIQFLEAVYGPFGRGAGVPAKEIAGAEKRLERKLPAALTAYYRQTGRVKALHASFNRLVAPGRLEFAGDHLVFYEENQEVVVWAIASAALEKDDPPVDQGQFDRKKKRWSFYPEFKSVSEFACAQGAWQAVQGGLPFVGVRDDHKAAPRLGAPALETSGMTAWLLPGGVVLKAGPRYLGLATRDKTRFLAASSKLGLQTEDWDWATLQDEAS